MILVGILLIGFGVLMFFWPDVFFALTESWKCNGSEPSDAYIRNTKFGGVMCAIAGSMGVVGGIIELFM